jgi:peptidoglycan/LPS O-acetylase OafA/YrhL
MIFGGAGATVGVPLLASAAMVLLGEASYAMYILHVPIRFWSELLLAVAGVDPPPRLYVALHITTVVVVSILVFRYVETPLRRWIARPPAAAPGN